jgi:hypothetical protein
MYDKYLRILMWHKLKFSEIVSDYSMAFLCVVLPRKLINF